MDESLLPPPARAERPFPWRASAALFVPAAALAAATGLQRWLEGPAPAGDALVRWLLYAGGAGLLLGAFTGLLRCARLFWSAYGAASPWLVAGLVLAGTRAARPLRERLADHREIACRAEGRRLCTKREFEAACARHDREMLGPAQEAVGAVQRWHYRGPFRPEELPFRGALVCSIAGSARASILAVADP